VRPELIRLLNLTERVGRDPLLTQASTGNSSAKLDGVLWIKASGKWMADARAEGFLIPLDLADVLEECRRQVDPAERFEGASLETALHATLPQRMVLHLHCINTIAWAVRADAEKQLGRRLEGLAWQWIPYAPSGLALAREMERAMAARPATDLFVLGNHGLVICGNDAESLEGLLNEVRQRLAIVPRKPRPADYEGLTEISRGSRWRLPKDDAVHALGTDKMAQAILAGGMLYPCQAIFSDCGTPDVFRPIACRCVEPGWLSRLAERPFVIVDGRGVLVSETIGPAELAMIRGLAQVVQRLSPETPLRYLTEGEIAAIPRHVASRYRELANLVDRV